MPHADFIHLRVHTAYSLAEGAIKIKSLAQQCQEWQMPAVAMTDTANLFGALEFSLTCLDYGVQPIIGCQLNIESEDSHHFGYDQLIVLAQNKEGYHHLLKLVTHGYQRNAQQPCLTLDRLAPYTNGLIALTGGTEGGVGHWLQKNQLAKAESYLKTLHTFFPDRLYIELQRHNMDSQRMIEPLLLDLAYQHSIPLVATNEAFFMSPSMHEAHDALLCIAQGNLISEVNRRRVTPHHSFKSAPEMRALFADLPEAIDNTIVIAQRCSYTPRPLKSILPKYPIEQGETEGEALLNLASVGLEHRLNKQVFNASMLPEEKKHIRSLYETRLKEEQAIIDKMGFSGYFLIVADFVQWAKKNNIPVGPGRGSGAGSLVAWALTITDIDPIRFGLIFERFLNPERISMPDFDIDFCQDRRDEVITYVQQKYGHDRVAQIITFGKLQARAVLRDVGRVLEMPYGQVDRLCKLVPSNPANPITLAEALEKEPQLAQARREDPIVGRLIEISLHLEGLYRHASTHAAGVVIGDRPLEELVPLYYDDASSMAATQFNMKYVEQAGLIKFDFLGLKTLTLLVRTTELLRDRGINVDLSTIPLDDKETFDLLNRVETVGVFQLESSGMRDVLRRLKPERFEEIIALVALFRPGPMDDIPRYLACRHGEEAIHYLHPQLEDILKETFGVMVYQEQVMKIAQVLAGYTLGGADLLRRAMGKKFKSEMDAQRKIFLEGATERGINPQVASQIFDQMSKFAGYGFNKSHAAPYALLAYQTAYLKANYPVEFMAASMTYDMNNTDKLNIYRQELQRMGIPLLPPDINASEVDFAVEKMADDTLAVRYALAAIKNVGGPAMASLVAERKARGSYKSIFDLMRRLPSQVINKRQLEHLVLAGALDSIHSNRHQVWAGLDLVLKDGQGYNDQKKSTQITLFGEIAPPSLPTVKAWDALETLQREWEALGFYLSAHPLDNCCDTLANLGIKLYTAALEGIKDGGVLRLSAIITAKQERMGKNGQKFAFIQCSDPSGVFEVVVFSELLAQVRELLSPGRAVVLSVSARVEGETIRLMANTIELLDEKISSVAQVLRLKVTSLDKIRILQESLRPHQAGTDKRTIARGTIHCLVPSAEGDIQVTLPHKYVLSHQLYTTLQALEDAS